MTYAEMKKRHEQAKERFNRKYKVSYDEKLKEQGYVALYGFKLMIKPKDLDKGWKMYFRYKGKLLEAMKSDYDFAVDAFVDYMEKFECIKNKCFWGAAAVLGLKVDDFRQYKHLCFAYAKAIKKVLNKGA